MFTFLLSHAGLLAACLSLLQPPATPTTTPAPPPVGPKAAVTDAERIANLRATVKQEKDTLAKAEARLETPDGEYQEAESEFESLNARFKALKAAAAALRKDGKDAAAVEAEAAALQEEWTLAKERFDIAIRQKKVRVEAIAGLRERLKSDQEELARLEGKAPAAAGGVPAPQMTATPTPVPAAPAPAPPTPLPTPAPPVATLPAMPGLPAAAALPVEAAPPAETEPAAVDLNSPAVRHARELVEARKAELADVRGRVAIAEERVAVMQRSVDGLVKMLQVERDAVTQAEKAVVRLEHTLQNQPPANPTERDTLAQKINETKIRLEESGGRAARLAERVGAMTETLAGQRGDLAVLTREAEAKRQSLADAEADLDALLSPTSPRNLFRWAALKAPRLIGILVGMAVLALAVRLGSRRVVSFATRHNQRGSADDRENRVSTLVGVFRYTAGLAVYGGGLVMLLDEVGLPIVPLMGGAAVIGLAVAFGTQNLIRDYFTGFLMLLEDQYSVNDVVRIGAISGMVEQITLRVTVLRDLEGVRHFIPHGGITSVSNLTHGWSRAVVAVRVAYKENVENVISVLLQVSKELRADRELGRHIWDDPEMLGVDELGESCVVIKLLLKTRPLKQWPVKREMLRRVKNRFDELGIQIPFPHQTVYHHFPEGHGPESLGVNPYGRALA